jgi:hypothetical protein
VPPAGREVSGAPDAEPPSTDGAAGCDVVPRDGVADDPDTPLGGEAARVPASDAPTGGAWRGGVWTGEVGSDGVLTDGVVMLGVLTCGVVTGPAVTDGVVTGGTVTDGTDTVGSEARGDEPDSTLTAAAEGAAETTRAAHAARTVSGERLMGPIATRVHTLRRT